MLHCDVVRCYHGRPLPWHACIAGGMMGAPMGEKCAQDKEQLASGFQSNHERFPLLLLLIGTLERKYLFLSVAFPPPNPES